MPDRMCYSAVKGAKQGNSLHIMTVRLLVALVLLCVATQRGFAQDGQSSGGASPSPQGNVTPAAPPGSATPTPTTLWNSVAGSVYRVRGVPHVAIGYSGTQRSDSEARSVAESQCRSAGGRNCKAVGAWSAGCVYITT